MIDKLRHTHPVDKLCQLMDVAKSGYQAWSRGKVIPARRLEDARLLTAIKAAHIWDQVFYYHISQNIKNNINIKCNNKRPDPCLRKS